jgi:hypothetical protein
MPQTPPLDMPQLILKPYMADPDSRRSRRSRRLAWSILLPFCLLYGFFFAFFAPYLMIPFVIPLAVMAPIVVWALPEAGAAPEKTLTMLFFAFSVALGLWPNYLALTLPGLPWITVARLTGFPLDLVFIICLSVSERFRKETASAVSGEPFIWKGVLVFVAIQFLSIIFSRDKGPSFDRFLMAQVSWTGVMFISAYIFMKPRLVTLWIIALWATLIPIGLIGVWENHLHHVPWLGHIPSFLRIDDPSITAVLYGSTRFGSGVYRVQSTFTTSITMSEYIALVVPFVFYYLLGSYRPAIKVAAFLTIVFMAYLVFLSNSRSGVIGLITCTMLYLIYWAAIKWRNEKGSILGPAIVISYPVIGAVVFGATLFVGRLHRLVWGGGQYANSTEARGEQVRLGLPKIVSHPWGYGIGEGAQALGFYAPGGKLTIDSYYLDIALEYGVLGFLVFYSIFAYTIFKSAQLSLTANDSNENASLLAPVAIALTNFFIIKAVFSQQDNNPIVFMLVGMALAMITRIRRESASKRVANPNPIPLRKRIIAV